MEDMVGIILAGVLFVALLATIAALLFYALLRWTPLGLRLQQNQNRRRLERELDLACPIHGMQTGRGDGAPAIRQPHLSGLLQGGVT
jgi:hypothetical protein